MGTVRSLNPAKGLEEFCNFLYGEEEGYIHLPIKRPEDGKYEYDFFFKWPAQRQDVIDHVERYSKHAEIYITPGMFKGKSSNVVDSHGSYVAWADFDGNVPSLEELQESGVPEPTLRVQSSIPGREHWYWRYEQFNNDVASVQGINRALSYALEADIGAWDAGHSLRPVGSYNHKRDAPVIVKSRSSNYYRVEDFASVPIPEISYNIEQFRKEAIPSPIRVMMKYGPWPDEAQDLSSKGHMAEGSRSSALTKLAYFCCEQGLDNSEVYSILRWKDKSWKKFHDRPDKEKYYVDLINYARQKVPYEGIKDVTVLADELQLYSWDEVVNYEDETEWIIPGILPARGKLFFVGQSGTGKTTLALGLTSHLALNKEHLGWQGASSEPKKVLFLSLEMMIDACKDFFTKLNSNFTEEEQELLKKNFKTYASPEKVKFYKPQSLVMGKFLRTLENYRPDIVLVDSASFAIASNLSNQEEVTAAIEILDHIQVRYNCCFIFIHHSRKDPPGVAYRDAELDDMFGSAFIAASAASVVALKRNKDYSESNRLMDIRYVKTRFSHDGVGVSVIMDGERRLFKRPSRGELMSSPTVPKQEKKETANDSFFSM